MKKNKKTGISLTFEADQVGTVLQLLRQPVEALVDLVQLREHFDYKAITDALTQAMAHPDIQARYLGLSWDDEIETLGHIPQQALALLIMPAILNNQVGLLRPLSEKLFNNYVAKDPLEHIDTYLFRDIDVYRTNDVLTDPRKDIYLQRLLGCRQASLRITAERLKDCLKTPNGCLFHDAWTNYAISSNWYRKSVWLKFGNNPVENTITHHLLKSGPGGKHAWAYPAALEKMANPSMGIKNRDYLISLDGFLSCKDPRQLDDPAFADALDKVYKQLYGRLDSLKSTKEGLSDNEWITMGIKEFHRIFFVPENGFVQQMRADPFKYQATLSIVLNMLKQPKSAQNLGIMAEYVSAMTGSGPLFKTGHGTMAHSLVQFGNLPVHLLKTPEKTCGQIKDYLDKLFNGTRNMDKVSQALDLISNAQQASLFGRIWPEAVKGRKNQWLQDQRMQQDLGL